MNGKMNDANVDMTGPEGLPREERPLMAEACASTSCCGEVSVPLLPAEAVDRTARLLKALGHPIRLQIMHILGRLGGQVCVCDIESRFAIKQPTVSHHLRTLREAGLIDAEQRGLFLYYRVRPEVLTLLRIQLRRMGT